MGRCCVRRLEGGSVGAQRGRRTGRAATEDLRMKHNEREKKRVKTMNYALDYISKCLPLVRVWCSTYFVNRCCSFTITDKPRHLVME